MLAKLVVHGSDRDAARRRLATALDELIVAGIVTNAGFHRWLVEQPQVVEGRVHTRFLDDTRLPEPPGSEQPLRIAACAWSAARQASRDTDVWSALGSFRTTPHRPTRTLALTATTGHGDVHEVAFDESGRLEDGALVTETDALTRRIPVAVDLASRQVALNLGGQTHTFRVLSRSEHWAPSEAAGGHGTGEATRAPFPGVVTETPVGAGDRVETGDVVVVLEAMKMLHSLEALGSGRVEKVHVRPGESVDSNQVLVSYELEGSADEDSAETGD